MDNLHCLDHLDGRPLLPGSKAWMTVAAWITWMDNPHCPDSMDGRPSLPGLPGWTTFIAWTTWTDHLGGQSSLPDYLDGHPPLPELRCMHATSITTPKGLACDMSLHTQGTRRSCISGSVR